MGVQLDAVVALIVLALSVVGGTVLLVLALWPDAWDGQASAGFDEEMDDEWLASQW